ncbi:hypothetical protein RND81_11G208800 [Saponaria officinalis]|uniref:AAA+ ATPase domain-containing protein n=1 Tax=Saponaria officinalis TaxID=3572 RepID=A0AAW1HPT4_SAPOF
MNNVFSVASLFTLYTSLTAILSLFQQFYNQFVPEKVRDYIASKIDQVFFSDRSPKTTFTLIVNEKDHEYEMEKNLLYEACEAYVTTKISSSAKRLTGSYTNEDEPISFGIAQGEEFVERLEKDGIQIVWKFFCRNSQGEDDFYSGHKKSFELCFDLAHKTEVLDSHIPLVVVKYYEEMKKTKKKINLYSVENGGYHWSSVQFSHPFTFDALALDPKVKQCIIDDLDKFIERKQFYKKVGKAWKRGYLLYGPPGTGKSSLIAAMANYLKYDIYDVQLSGVEDDAMLRRMMLSTENKSILVIEDIDCAMGLSRDYSTDNAVDFENDESDDELENRGSRVTDKDTSNTESKVSLSGILNFIDGLWSCCADERIIVLTTNRKEKLDKALLRPGRMDMHIHMSYLTMNAFKILANNYLGVTGEHSLYNEIEQLLETANATPAQVAEELLRSDDVDVALSSVVDMLKKRLNRLERLQKKGNDKSRKSLKGHELNKDESVEKMPDICGDIRA